MRKEAQFGGMPGDPGLPPGVSQRDIDQNAGSGFGPVLRKQNFYPVILRDTEFLVTFIWEETPEGPENIRITKVLNEENDDVTEPVADYIEDAVRDVIVQDFPPYY